MHPDSLSSVVYRSFITCDGAKGVVECGTIRKSRSSSQKIEHNIRSQKAKKSPDKTFLSESKKKEEMLSKEITEEFRSPSSFQLLNVSRGAQNPNQIIDALSQGKSFDGQPKNVAKDMLKGAFNLQESIMILGKLQEASQYMASLKKQQKSHGRKNDELGIQRGNSYHLGQRNYQMGVQKLRLSADGSSRDKFEEFRNAIRASLARPNLLPKTDTEEKISFHQRHLDSDSEIASTSSSQSSVTHTNNYSSIDSHLSSATVEKNVKSPNLIAKLLGLEEFPSKPLQKQLKNENIFSQQRPMFDFDMPTIRKSQLVLRHEKPEHRTLKEILETMHVTRILKSDSVNGLKSYPHHFSDAHAKQSLIGNNPPIVVIKPLRGQVLDADETFAPMFQEKDVKETKMMLKELKVKEEFPSKTDDRKEKVLKCGKMRSNPETDETPIKGLSKEGEYKENKKAAEKPESKESKKVAEKPEEAKISQKCCNKKNTSGYITNRTQKKELVDKKVDGNPKAMISRKPIDKRIEESKNVSTSRDQGKMSATKVKKTEKGSSAKRNQARRQQNSPPNPTSNPAKQTVNQNSNDRKNSLIKKEKPVSEPATAKSTTHDIGSKEDDKKIDFTCASNSVLIKSNDTCVDQLATKEETDATEFHIGEHCDNRRSTLNDAVLLTSQCMRDPKVVEEVDDNIPEIRMESKGYELKLLLSSNAVFLSQVQELFDLNVNCPKSLQTSGINDIVVTTEKLSMNIAKEIVERISLPDSKLVHPLLLTWLRNSRISLSLDELLEEVCDGVESLESYNKLPGETEKRPTDRINAMLEKDIRCKGVVSGIWDLGWRNEFSADTTEQVVNDIEKLLLSGLIDEIII